MTYDFLLLYHVYVCGRCQFNSSPLFCMCSSYHVNGISCSELDLLFLPSVSPALVCFPLCTFNINVCAKRASLSNIIFLQL